jgi:hypothetical protein
MALTKSLHTVTAATAVATLLLKHGATADSGAALADMALKALGHALDGSETSQRIVANCKALLVRAGVL